jgi:hypothetical protein
METPVPAAPAPLPPPARPTPPPYTAEEGIFREFACRRALTTGEKTLVVLQFLPLVDLKEILRADVFSPFNSFAHDKLMNLMGFSFLHAC